MKIRLLLFFLLFSYVAFAQAIQGTASGHPDQERDHAGSG